MRRDLIRRLGALEAKRARHGGAECAPVPEGVRRDVLREAAACERRGMPAHAASARRLADGHIVGRGLLVPAVIDADTWSRLARDQQIELADLERRASA
ncbi:hypothetical protein EV148_105229 [Dokdonella fugitiva]|uniref:Uncharacterized protein n=1 Tax=Dokdonella fugitiva TaxID=328517 RepID=A0A4R2I7X9_9GAMM|nr:hypothetical protein EV148_105229 [Dokdonella fugitiva]